MKRKKTQNYTRRMFDGKEQRNLKWKIKTKRKEGKKTTQSKVKK